MKVDVGDIRLYVDIDGFSLRPDGGVMREYPTIVLIHGGPGFDHTSQKSFAPLLAQFAQVVCYDQRGHGRSDRAGKETWTLAAWADDVVRLCDSLGIERPIVMGASFGGIVAQAYAIRHPGHPAKLILHCTAPRFSLDRIAAKFEALGGPVARQIAVALWRNPGDPALLGPYMEVCMPLYNTSRRDPSLMKSWGIMSPDPLTHFYSHGGEGHRFDFRAELCRIACPTLVLAGEEDPICPVQDSEDIAAAMRSDLCEFRRFPNCGHGINWDDREAFLGAIRDFISK